MTNEQIATHQPDRIEADFAKELRYAAYIFENEKNGRFQGSILACRAVIRFIKRRNGGAELAAPFAQIAEAFKYLEKGGKPSLFSKKTVPEKERARSPERKQYQMLAAAALEVLVELGDERRIAADKIARAVSLWPDMGKQKITGQTVIAWRKQWRTHAAKQQEPFKSLVKAMLEEADPRNAVKELLLKGPPGMWQR